MDVHSLCICTYARGYPRVSEDPLHARNSFIHPLAPYGHSVSQSAVASASYEKPGMSPDRYGSGNDRERRDDEHARREPTMTSTTLAMPPIVDSAIWSAALEKQAALEDKLMEQVLSVSAARRRMPMTPVQGDYTFVGAEGERNFADLFNDHHQLVVYHFMFAPDWQKGCPHCTQYARNQGAGINDELTRRDTRFILTSRAPYQKLAAWAEEKGIATPWYSAPTAFSEEMGAITDDFGDIPGVSIFFRDGENNVYRTWRSGGAAIESTMPASGMLRMVPYGMQEKGEDSPVGWPQPFEPLG